MDISLSGINTYPQELAPGAPTGDLRPCYSIGPQSGVSKRFVEGDLRLFPRALDGVFDAGETRHAVADQLVDQEQRAADGRRADNQRGNRQVVGQRRSE